MSECVGVCYACDGGSAQVPLLRDANAAADAFLCAACGSDFVELREANADTTSNRAVADANDRVAHAKNDDTQSLSSSGFVDLCPSPSPPPVVAAASAASAASTSRTAAPAAPAGQHTGLGPIVDMFDDVFDALIVQPLNQLTSRRTSNSPSLFQVTTELLSSADALDCAVCRCDLELDESVVELPCKHLYHRECITPWLEQTSTCPTCRHQLPTADTKFERRRRRT